MSALMASSCRGMRRSLFNVKCSAGEGQASLGRNHGRAWRRLPAFGAGAAGDAILALFHNVRT